MIDFLPILLFFIILIVGSVFFSAAVIVLIAWRGIDIILGENFHDLDLYYGVVWGKMSQHFVGYKRTIW